MPEQFTSEQYEEALRKLKVEDGWDLPFSVYEASKAALQIAARAADDICLREIALELSVSQSGERGRVAILRRILLDEEPAALTEES